MTVLDKLWIFQQLHTSTSTLAVMCDATLRTLNEMKDWEYTTKEEMKRLGSTMILMEDKFTELVLLGISKMVEDFLNDLGKFANIEFKNATADQDGVRYAREVQVVRLVSNVIKHDNSIIEIATGGSSAKKLVQTFGFSDSSLLRDSSDQYPDGADALLRNIFYAYEFCMDLMERHAPLGIPRSQVDAENIVGHMLDRYVRQLPGHPEADGR